MFRIIRPYPGTVFIRGGMDFFRPSLQVISVWSLYLLFAKCSIVDFDFIDDSFEIRRIRRSATDIYRGVGRSNRRSGGRAGAVQYTVDVKLDNFTGIEIAGHRNMVPQAWSRTVWRNRRILSALGIPKPREKSAALDPDAEIKALRPGKDQIGIDVGSR